MPVHADLARQSRPSIFQPGSSLCFAPGHRTQQEIHLVTILAVTLSLRERAFILLAIIVAIFLIWDKTLLSPLEVNAKQLQAKVKKQAKELARVREQQQAILDRASIDPDAQTRKEIEALQTAMVALDKRLREMTVNLVDPARMASVLEDVLTRNTELKLIRVEALAPTPLTRTPVADEVDQTTAEKQLPSVYQHSLKIVFEGSYLQTLDYMRQVEELSQQFYWGSVDFKVDEFPSARVTITVNTLSLNEAWIGV